MYLQAEEVIINKILFLNFMLTDVLIYTLVSKMISI